MSTATTAKGTGATHRRTAVPEDISISKRQRRILGIAGIIGVLAVWQLLSTLGVLNKTLTSSPVLMWQTFLRLSESGVLGSAALSSARLFFSGFVIAAAIGIPAGIILGWFTRISAFADPWVSILYAAPRIAFIPLIIVWTGVGLEAQIVLVVLSAVFPIIINVAAGVQNTDRQYLRVARSFNASTFDVLRTVALPGAVPFVVSGLRQGLMMGLVGTVVAEYFIGNTGIGGLIFTAGVTLDTATAYVGAALFAIAAIVLTAALRKLETYVNGWRA